MFAFGAKEKIGEVVVLKYLEAQSMASSANFRQVRQGPMPEAAPGASLRFTALLDFQSRIDISRKFGWPDVPLSVAFWGDVLDDLAFIARFKSIEKKTAQEVAKKIAETLIQLAHTKKVRDIGLSQTLLNAQINSKDLETEVVLLISPKRMTLLSNALTKYMDCLLYTSPSPRDATLSRMPSSA